MTNEPITMLLSLAPILSAIKIGHDEARITFSVPLTERDALKRLMDCQGRVLSAAFIPTSTGHNLTEVDFGNVQSPEKDAKRSPPVLDRRRTR